RGAPTEHLAPAFNRYVTPSTVATLPDQTRGGRMTPRIDEVAPDLYRISVYVKDFDLQFNHFLVKDDEPLLFHTGLRGMFPLVREGVAKVIDPREIRSIAFSHFESDECGGLNLWLAECPSAQAVFSDTGVLVNLNDFA